MGIQINQLCNMNMKFAALLLFVGVTSAVSHWCLHPVGSLECPGEEWSGQATAICCQEQNPDIYRTELGCDATVAYTQFNEAKFVLCCDRFGCDGTSNVARK